jgi:hypothetical protein
MHASNVASGAEWFDDEEEDTVEENFRLGDEEDDNEDEVICLLPPLTRLTVERANLPILPAR